MIGGRAGPGPPGRLGEGGAGQRELAVSLCRRTMDRAIVTRLSHRGAAARCHLTGQAGQLCQAASWLTARLTGPGASIDG